jgi:hypothetical protein
MAAVTQVRHRHSKGRAYYDKKIAGGKTPKEALVLPASRLRRLHPGRSSPHPAETRADPQHQLIERPEPAIGAYAVASGHRKIVLSPHKP